MGCPLAGGRLVCDRVDASRFARPQVARDGVASAD
jgi:hypothetical protein